MSRYELMSAGELCREAAGLLGQNGHNDWARSFAGWADQFGAEPDQTARAISSASRGWSDLVLYRDGVLLAAENNALRDVFDELTRLCTHALKPSKGS